MLPTTLNNIELPAPDMAAAKRFYESNFGWTFTDYGPTYAAAQVSGLEVGFTTEATVCTPQPNGEQSANGPLLLMQTDDLVAARVALDDAGVSIVTEPFDFPGGSRLHFRDVSGNVLGIYELTSAE